MKPRALLVFAVVFAAAAPAAAAGLDRVDEMVVFPDGPVRIARVHPNATSVEVGRKRCSVPAGTPLAALVDGKLGPLTLHDYGSCSSRGADAGGLFVRGIAGVMNKGSDGWVYKVQGRLGVAGAADPSGPFGHGRITNGGQITWFWCHVTAAQKGCQHTLDVVFLAAPNRPDLLKVRVREHDDHGRTTAVPGATVHAGARAATTDANGIVTFTVAKGDHYPIWAEAPGRIRSFRRYWSEP